MSELNEQFDISDAPQDAKEDAEKMTEDNNHESCPIHSDPVQITGLYKCSPNEEQNTFIDNYDDSHLRCQYPTEQDIADAKKRASSSPDGAKLRQTMKNCFDRIIYILENAIDIHISEALAEELLVSWCKDAGWKFYHVSRINLPFSLLWSVRPHSLFGKLIKKDSPLHRALVQKGHNFEFKDNGDYVRVTQKDGKFLNAAFLLYNHMRSETDTGMSETVRLRITEDNLCIYEQTIDIDPDYIHGILDSTDWPQTERGTTLLDFADEILG